MARAPVRVALGRRGADGAAAVARDACLVDWTRATRCAVCKRVRRDLFLASRGAVGGVIRLGGTPPTPSLES